MIILTIGKPVWGMSYVCTPSARTPELPGPSGGEVRRGGAFFCDNCPAKNSEYCEIVVGCPWHTQTQNPLGHLNRDKTGRRMVRKGCKLDYHGMVFVVHRVRKGVAYGETIMQKQYFFAPTNSVKVLD